MIQWLLCEKGKTDQKPGKHHLSQARYLRKMFFPSSQKSILPQQTISFVKIKRNPTVWPSQGMNEANNYNIYPSYVFEYIVWYFCERS